MGLARRKDAPRASAVRAPPDGELRGLRSAAPARGFEPVLYHRAPMPLSIRRYRSEDAAELDALVRAAVHAIPDALYSPPQRAAWAPEGLALGERFERVPPELAVVDGTIAGFMALESDGHIDMAYVHPAHQRAGVAAALYDHLEARARSARIGRLFAEVSVAARPFFQSRGFVVRRENLVLRGGQRLPNATMDKRLCALGERGRLFVIGNSGAGKTTLAAALAEDLGRARVDLDEVAFLDQAGTRRPIADSLARLRGRSGLETAAVEGCYADLIEAMATARDHLIWLDLDVAACQANARERPFEPHKWPSAEAQEAFVPKLLEFIAGYETSPDPTGRPAHRALFERFVGTKERHPERPSAGSLSA